VALVFAPNRIEVMNNLEAGTAVERGPPIGRVGLCSSAFLEMSAGGARKMVNCCVITLQPFRGPELYVR
jgi:hypothetical protein